MKMTSFWLWLNNYWQSTTAEITIIQEVTMYTSDKDLITNSINNAKHMVPSEETQQAKRWKQTQQK
jgi:carboxypeptidase C (cathepsin A)